jgi:hypothetical protein
MTVAQKAGVGLVTMAGMSTVVAYSLMGSAMSNMMQAPKITSKKKKTDLGYKIKF